MAIFALLWIIFLSQHFQFLNTNFSRATIYIRVQLSRLAQHCIKKLNYINKTFLVTEVTVDDSFVDLTPNEETDSKKEEYAKAIGWALENPRIKNIAVTGPYGAGKSSIITTFQKSHAEYSYLNISLASFKEYTENDTQKNTQKNELIEFSILQQIFYHVKREAIPYSRFKRIKNISKTNLLFRATAVICWIAALLYLIRKKKLPLLDTWSPFLTEHDNTIKFVCLGVVFLGSIFIFYLIFRIYSNSKFSKLNITSGEMEIAPDVDSSVLNKHLDEILYFFQVTDFNVLIVEDLDRFKNPEIFTKLREINTLINNSKQVGRRVCFIYALKDDIFLDEKRTKFFDFIIPIIPITNSANSGELLKKRIDKFGLTSLISGEFISDISLYISDMRLLINILNEFQIYRMQLMVDGETGPKLTKLLAIIIYKNKYPTDFAQLHHDEGLVYDLFERKKKFIDEEVKRLHKMRNQTLADIEMRRRSAIQNLSELRMLYVGAVVMQMPANFDGRIYLSSYPYTIPEILQSEHFDKLKKLNPIRYSASPYSSETSSGVSFEAVSRMVNEDKSYDQREAEMKVLQEHGIQELESELRNLNEEIASLKLLSIKETLAKREITDLNPDFKNHRLLSYLIRYGYLNEEYHFYMSYFYEGTITKADREFFFAVKENRTLPSGYALGKIEGLVKILRTAEYDRPSVLNIDLLNHLLNNRNDYTEELAMIFTQLRTLHEIATTFINAYIISGKRIDIFVEELCAVCKDFWYYIEKQSGFDRNTKNRYLNLILAFARPEDVVKLNGDDLIGRYISFNGHDFFIIVSGIPIPVIIGILQSLDVKLEVLNPDDRRLERFEEIIELIRKNGFFQVNVNILQLLMETCGDQPADLEEAFNTSNYTTILNSGCTDVISVIDRNIGDYLERVFLELRENSKESETTIVSLLNRADLTIEQKESIIETQDFQLSDIALIIDREIWDILLIKSKLKPTWQNILECFEPSNHDPDKEAILSVSLTHFLNISDHYKALKEDGIANRDNLPEDGMKHLAFEIYGSPDLSDSTVKGLLDVFKIQYSPQDLHELSESRIELLIDNRKLEFTTDRFVELSRISKELSTLFVEKNLDLFFEIVSNLEMDSGDYINLLSSAKLDHSQKEILINTLRMELIKNNKVLAESVIKQIKDTGFQINYDMMMAIVSRVDIEEEDRKWLIFREVETLTFDQMKALFIALGGAYAKINEKKFTDLDNSLNNSVIFEAFKKRKFLTWKNPPELSQPIRVKYRMIAD